MNETKPFTQSDPCLLTIHIISDSVGITGQAIARAAASQFGEPDPRIMVLPHAGSFDEIKDYLAQQSTLSEQQCGCKDLLVFYTLVNKELAESLRAYLEDNPHVRAVDLMTEPLAAIAAYSGLEPLVKPGKLHVADQHYFRRIEAIEFTIAHDDGRNPQDMVYADIVLIGVSRSSKTPLAIYLAQEGFRVSNVPLDPQTQPPKELYDVDPTRLFGLMTTPEVLTNIRQRRLGKASVIAGDYANFEKVSQDLENSRALMRKLGCIIVRTDNRAVEETAQEILRYYELAHPRTQIAEWAGTE